MTDVEIHYCVPCGHLDRAQQLQYAILDQYGQDVDRVALRTGDGGVFTVSVDGEQVFDVDEDEYDADAIVESIDERC
ncbi:selT/selW/selH selenoprotein domain protein [Salinarchaeum sp. Harcht-Bsk1]|uniref:SelT/SelW/SelH family protein n=1 Tax=Salinarchaeum sp. Harcht-Bsk1 TaxID=1333523 RepID=UPI0003422A04|nr:Rdx family protein [Salinarchaeum sp. Harcht-Bsk1]AGN02524.1 selT/selW/selH selenoprotein domain protein [Salinarchaeum sp. Harcht-Bsk1]